MSWGWTCETDFGVGGSGLSWDLSWEDGKGFRFKLALVIRKHFSGVG